MSAVAYDRKPQGWRGWTGILDEERAYEREKKGKKITNVGGAGVQTKDAERGEIRFHAGAW